MIELIVGFLTGIIASMGLGGGFVLIIYLVAFAGIDQLTAQGMNLTFFIPISILSLVLHNKNKMVEWRVVPKFAVTGIIGAAIGTLFALNLEAEYLKTAFSVLLIIVGFKELLGKPKKE